MSSQITIPELKEHLQARKNNIGLIGTRLDVNEVDGNSMSGHIATSWDEIQISFGKQLDLVPDAETKQFASKKYIKDAKLKVGEDILEHEAGHRENKVGERLGCPYDLWTHERIKEGIAKGLQEVGKTGLENYVTNAFEDALDNINCRRHTDFTGQTLFWNNQGLFVSPGQKFVPFYEAFVRINLMLGGDASSHSLLNRFYSNKPEVNEAVSEFLKEVKKASGEQFVFRMHQKPGFQRLFNPQDVKSRAEDWSALAYQWGKILGKLADEVPKERMFGSGEGDENSPEQNPFDNEMKMPANRQKIARQRYEQGLSPAPHRDLQEQLYDFYKSISKDIPVETSHYTASQSIPIVHFGRRFVKEDEQRFKFRGVGINEEGELAVKTAKHSISYPVTYKKHRHKFPNFKLALMDRSGSMALNPKNETDGRGNPKNIGSTSFVPWGDKSKYHFALKGYIGIDNFLERQGVAPYIENCVLGYSGEGAVRGKIEKVAKSLLTAPSGGTSLDISGLERELEENALLISISDGEMDLNADIKKRLKAKLETCDYAHFQIGGRTEYSSYLEELGRQVTYVNGDEDLSKAMVSFVSGYYRQKPQKVGETIQ